MPPCSHARCPHLEEAYRGTRALVLGASGFIGRWVARLLSHYGAGLTLVVRDPSSAEAIFRDYQISGRMACLEIESGEGWQQLIDEIRPSVVFNLIGYGVDHGENDPERAARVNERFVQQLGRCLTKAPAGASWPGMTLVHAGSALEYGSIGGDLDETSIPRPETLYGQTKLAGTAWLAGYASSNGLKAITARLFTVYGPGEHPARLLPSLLETASSHRVLPLSAGTQRRDFTFVPDVAEGLLRLGMTPSQPGTVVNLATGRLTSVRDFVEIAASVITLPRDLLGFGMIDTRFQEIEHMEVTLERLKAITGWIPATSIREGVRQTIGWPL